jgi:hypothetical protein
VPQWCRDDESLDMLRFLASFEATKLNMECRVLILNEEAEVVTRLEQLGTTKAELIDVVRAAVGGRRQATPFDPLSAGGQFAWIYGTRQLRAIFVNKGWESCRADNIESVFNPAIGIKIMYQSAERAGDRIFDPLSISKKGAGAARAVEMGQEELWPEMRERELRESNAANWYLFVYAIGDDVRAELSFPKAIEGDQFHGFHERILLVQHGEWAGIDITPDEAPIADFDVTVTAKE